MKEISDKIFIEDIDKDDFFEKHGDIVKVTTEDGKSLIAIKWDKYKELLPKEEVEKIETEMKEIKD